MIDISLLYTRPTTRNAGKSDRVDIFLSASTGSDSAFAYYVDRQYAEAIINAIAERDLLFDLLTDLVGDFPAAVPSNALEAARAYLAAHPAHPAA